MSDSTCPICEGTGWKVIERGGLTGAVRCDCARTARSQELREKSNIPPNCARASLDNFQIPQDNPTARMQLGRVLMEVRAFVREFPAQDHPGLLLVGDTGTGKTHLAVAALKALIERGHEGLFFDYQSLLDKIRSSYDSSAGSGDKEAFRTALDAEILLLDDLGSHRVTDWVEDTVTSIITHRCNNQKPTIATTNLDPEAVIDYTSRSGTDVARKSLGEVIGKRACSRLFEMCRIVRMPAVEDYRIKRAR